ncbi:gametocyte-specific factor 1 [Plakobranchus ocellatus]|uniref:Gametocyte-specific factor 1 n=1 Tax=Plakobranchus ocellatus TaxID=259542 RepID=A0AAV4DPV9_9GAST|nr:gametocyte-specific factor 1 [Plakobranchus ocellatus]
MEDDRLVCPYDPSHCIDPLRMPRHLLKCRKNHPSVTLAVCPFNGFHEVPSQELQYHMQHCPNKALLDRDFELDIQAEFSSRRRLKGFTDLPKSSNDKLVSSNDELWEPDQTEENFAYQRTGRRNFHHSRRRYDENSHLRLPTREGRAARLAASASAFDSSNNFNSRGLEDHRNANQRPSVDEFPQETLFGSTPQGFQPQQSIKQVRGESHFQTDFVEVDNSSTISHALPSSDLSQSTCQSTSPLTKPQESTTNTGSYSSSAAQNRTQLNVNDCLSVDDKNSNSQPKKSLLDVDYKAFLLGRGRALLRHSDQRSIGRSPGVSLMQRSAANSVSSSNDTLTLVARLLGRGRGLTRASNTVQ